MQRGTNPLKYDYNHFDYKKVGNHSNVIAAIPKGMVHSLTPTGAMDVIFTSVALRNPDWTFIAYPKTDTLVACDVYKYTEHLGSVSTALGYNARQCESVELFEVRSKRITGMRQNGVKKTKNPKTALKTIKKTFIPMSHAELAAHTQTTIYNKLHRTQYNIDAEAGRAFIGARHEILGVLKGKATADSPTLTKLLASTDKADVAAKIKARLSSGNGGRYIKTLDADRVLCVTTAGYSVIKNGDLDKDTAVKLAMLKLSDDEAFVEDVGYRCDETFFLVLA